MGVQQFPGIELCFVWNRKKRGTEKKTQKIPVVSSNKYVFKPLPTNLFSGIAHSKTIHLNCSYDSMRLLPRKNHWPYVKIVFELFSCVLSLSSVLGGFIWIIFMCSIIIISIRKVHTSAFWYRLIGDRSTPAWKEKSSFSPIFSIYLQ